ncbi:MAG TPA: DUF5916 domain-containing protein, partial [Saprospiraceae bacterium]|nr:DUF5916 domain-containing protein [Saprospiraceae bacterium]
MSLCVDAQTQLAAKKTLSAFRIQEKINLDARLDEPAWQSAPVAADFLYRWPTPGRAASVKTEVRVLYDDEALYVAFSCFDSPDSIFHRLSKRDELENTDFVFVVIDTYRDGQNAVKFGVTPDNVQTDSKFSLANADPNNDNADGEDWAWDAVWASSARITEAGWTAEFAIPYAALRFPKKDVQEWGVNFQRVTRRKGETDCWNEIKAEITGTLNQMGILTGIRDIKAPLRLSATPFVAAYANNVYNQPQGPGSGWAYPYSVGMDVKYGINEAFTLDATVIPDFGQVRTDSYVLNLSPFEVRFNENRPFFTEGTELFSKGGLFYSRRVGGGGAQLLNATKISGRTKSGLGIGLFNAVENSAYHTTKDDEGNEVREQIRPLTNKNILVFDQNLPHNSSVTLINTNVMRSGHNTDANVTGALLNLKNKAQSYALSGRAVYSTRQRAEGPDNGFSTGWDLSKTSGNFLWGASYVVESDRYNPNDLGFLFSPNESSGNVWVNYNRYKPWWKMNNYWVSLWGFNGMLYKPANTWTETAFGFNMGGNTRSFHNFGININTRPWGENDYFEPRTGGFEHYYHIPANVNMNTWYNSDHRKRLTFYANGGVRLFRENGRRSTSLYAGTRWRASDRLTIGLGLGNDLGFNNVGGLWADQVYAEAKGYEGLPSGAILLGRRDIVSFNNDINVNYAFTNRMNIALFSRHYWNRVMYHDFGNLQPDGSLQPSTYTGHSSTGEHLNDIAVNYFNIDLVYTWRFAPGSDLLLVYKNFIGHEASGRDVAHDYGYN